PPDIEDLDEPRRTTAPPPRVAAEEGSAFGAGLFDDEPQAVAGIEDVTDSLAPAGSAAEAEGGDESGGRRRRRGGRRRRRGEGKEGAAEAPQSEATGDQGGESAAPEAEGDDRPPRLESAERRTDED